MKPVIPSMRTAARLTAAILVLAGTGWLAAQAPRPQPGTKDEVEDPTAARPRAPFRVGDEGTDPPPSPLAQDAQQAKHFLVRDLFQQLKEPHDLVTLRDGRTLTVQPIGPFLGANSTFDGELTLQVTDLNGKLGPVVKATAAEVTRFEPYEQVAVRRVNDFLQSKLDSEPAGSAKHLARTEMFTAADRALTAVLAFHQRGRRSGSGWDGVSQRLRDRLQQLQVDWLKLLEQNKDWPAADRVAERLAEAKPLSTPGVLALAAFRLRQAEEQLSDDKNLDGLARAVAILMKVEPQLRDRSEDEFRSVQRHFIDLQKRLRDKAAEQLREAQLLKDRNKPTEALALVRKIQRFDPQLPGLAEFLLEVRQSQPQILNVGVRRLPQFFTPTAAVTDVERQAVELLFESLVRPVTDAAGGQHFASVLAQGPPQFLPLARQFQLRPDARWSNGKPVTATDVTGTVELLKQRERPGFVPEWADLISAHTDDPSRVTLTLKRGYLDPLALMTFKVLPAAQLLKRLDEPQFARRPIGSGPFCFPERSPTNGKDVFLEANSQRKDRPLLEGIRFYLPNKVVSDFSNDLLHLLLDASPRDMVELAEAKLPYVHLRTVPQRRVSFLAINHRPGVSALLADQNIRLAIAHAIDREHILQEHFRGNGSLPATVHRALAGPYPPGCWASDRTLENKMARGQAYDPTTARALIKGKDGKLIELQELRLKFPDDPPEIEAACNAIKVQVQNTIGVRIKLVKLDPYEFKTQVERNHDFQLAYCSWDYADETYWLWPLFDPNAIDPRGLNYMGYIDGELAGRFRQVLEHRAFEEVRLATHRIHQQIYEKAPLIPLWQLDRHLAIHDDLVKVMTGRDAATVPLGKAALDPQALFADVTAWKLHVGR